MMMLSEAKDIATIVGIAIAITTYITNSYFQFRNKRVENLTRFFESHDKLFDKDGYIVSNIKEMEDGTYKRNLQDKDMEVIFNRLLGGIEKVAMLTAHNAISKEVQVYMFGWFSQRIQPQITNEERNNIYWELAIHYLDEMKKAADDYCKHDCKKRAKYLQKHKLSHS